MPSAAWFKERLNRPALIGFCMFASLMALTCSLGSQALEARQPISLQELETLCRLPAPCEATLPCHGEDVTIQGFVDPLNIFSRQRFPGMPYEKFKIVDHDGRAIEIWPQAADNRPIFEKLDRRPTDRIVVNGELSAFKLPITGQCNQGVKVLIHAASQIEFK